MKLYLIAVLFLATIVVVPCLAEEDKQETPDIVADVPEVADTANNLSEQSEEDGGNDAKDEEKSEDFNEQIPKEFRDEIAEHEKRALPQLSRKSCLILKRYGFCKTNVKRFCVKVCPPSCGHDNLSRISCRRVRFTYKACRQRIGQLYCRKTCGYCLRKLPAQCRRYKVINDISRRQSLRNKVFRCDSGLRSRWYRFHGRQGTYIPNRCVKMNRCGTRAPGWLVGNYPIVRGTNVRRKVCYTWTNGCCQWHNYIYVTHCGSYYVFYLTKPPHCTLRYCGNL